MSYKLKTTNPFANEGELTDSPKLATVYSFER